MMTLTLTKRNGHKKMMHIEDANIWVKKHAMHQIIWCIYVDDLGMITRKAHLVGYTSDLEYTNNFYGRLVEVKVNKQN